MANSRKTEPLAVFKYLSYAENAELLIIVDVSIEHCVSLLLLCRCKLYKKQQYILVGGKKRAQTQAYLIMLQTFVLRAEHMTIQTNVDKCIILWNNKQRS